MVAAQVGVVVPDPASVHAAIESRFSTCAFLPTPVARSMPEDILRVASRAASGVNAQPRMVYLLQGASRAHLDRRRENGWGLYGLLAPNRGLRETDG